MASGDIWSEVMAAGAVHFICPMFYLKQNDAALPDLSTNGCNVREVMRPTRISGDGSTISDAVIAVMIEQKLWIFSCLFYLIA